MKVSPAFGVAWMELRPQHLHRVDPAAWRSSLVLRKGKRRDRDSAIDYRICHLKGDAPSIRSDVALKYRRRDPDGPLIPAQPERVKRTRTGCSGPSDGAVCLPA